MRKKRARNITTIIVDTEHLVTIETSEPSIWTIPPQQDDIVRAALNDRERSENSRDPTVIISHHSGISAYTQHSGDMFKSMLFGDVDDILVATTLPENERERIMLAARRHHVHGSHVEAIAQLTHTTPLTTAAIRQADFLGLVSSQVIPYPSIHKSLTRAQQRGLTIRYISRDNHAFVSGVAHAVGLLPRTKEASRFNRYLTPTEAIVLSDYTKSAYETAHQVTDPTILIAHHPLPAIIEMLDHYRSRLW